MWTLWHIQTQTRVTIHIAHAPASCIVFVQRLGDVEVPSFLGLTRRIPGAASRSRSVSVLDPILFDLDASACDRMARRVRVTRAQRASTWKV